MTQASSPSPSSAANPIRQRGAVLWFTGLSGSGKSTLSVALAQRMREAGKIVVRLDGDLIRKGISADLGFSPEDRAENVLRVADAARHLADAGIIVLCALISPYEASRRAAQARIEPATYSLVHVATSIETCESRDPKGLYKKARAGEIPSFTGISAPYEEPESPDCRIVGDGPLDEKLDRLWQHCAMLGLVEAE